MNPKGLSSFAAGGPFWTRRLIDEPPSPTRMPFHRDRDRLIHATAFRRLKHKTQVFIAPEGDHFRTRLTHSLEVAQIGRAIARTLGLDEDLTETLALAHDLGHPPFGHAGEEALNECMAAYGGFDHNAQTLRIVTRLEQRYPRFDGLNLTYATLDGLIKHNGPIGDKGLPFGMSAIIAEAGIIAGRFGTGEAQIAAIADDVAYSTHDVDDGLRAGLFELSDIEAIPLAQFVLREIHDEYPKLERKRLVSELARRLIGRMVDDLLHETRGRLRVRRPESPEDIAASSEPVVAFTAQMRSHVKTLKEFLFTRMYRHYRVNRMLVKAKRVVQDLFTAYFSSPALLPPDSACESSDEAMRARDVADFIAGMTDNFALAEHRRLFDPATRA